MSTGLWLGGVRLQHLPSVPPTQLEISQACPKLLILPACGKLLTSLATGLLVSSGGNRLAGTGLSQQPATNLLLTRDNRSDRTTCNKSVEINRFVTTCYNFCQVCSKLVIRPATNLSTTNNFCPVTTSFNKPVVGKQIENVSKEKNRTKWTLPAASLSHSIIAIAILNHIGETIVSILWLNAKAAALFLKNSSDFQNPNSNLLTCAVAIFL
jgi:hypothetical protein